MSNVIYHKGSLFDAPKGSIICHAVNCKGVWGSGIAKQFKERYPQVYYCYNGMCAENGAGLRGSCFLIENRDFTIACLFTSVGFGGEVDSPEDILEATQEALEDLLWQNNKNLPIHMCKINSGLFAVPWDKTEDLLESSDDTFHVWSFE